MGDLVRKLPFLIMILDGYAHNPNPRANAVKNARKPNLDKLFSKYPLTELVTFGERVGLPDDQMGNSEVGHLNIGAGRVVEQDLLRINKAIERGVLRDDATLKRAIADIAPGRALHFIGLCGSGGVHSQHLEGLLKETAGDFPIYIHAITDGRDRPPRAAIDEISHLEEYIAKNINVSSKRAQIVSVIGRYWAMDRDKRWERTQKAYDLFTLGKGDLFKSAKEAIQSRYDAGQTDEFVEPCVISTANANRKTTVQDGDVLCFFNFRADRMRQIVSTFLGRVPEVKRDSAPSLPHILTLTEYDPNYDVEVLFPPIKVRNHFGEVVSKSGLRQLRVAETEKYAHVTYFFNGGIETPYENEERVLIPSPRDVPTYDLKPEMSAYGVTDAILDNIKQGRSDVIVVNFANCDMVGHTGNYDAAVKAVESVDTCVGKVLELVSSKTGSAIITADHGNADQMEDYDTGEPHTFHTKYPVPCCVFGEGFEKLKLRTGGALCDIAPTACELLGLSQPAEMTGKSLIVR